MPNNRGSQNKGGHILIYELISGEVGLLGGPNKRWGEVVTLNS